MAAIWTVVTTVADLDSRQIKISATRTDGEDKWSISIDELYDTEHYTKPELRDRYVDNIWDHYERHVAQQAQIDAILAVINTAVASELDAKETP